MRHLRTKISMIILVALILFAVAVVLSRGESVPHPFQILFWIAILAGAELLPVSLGFGTEVTMAFPIHLALAITFRNQPWVAMAIAGLGAADLREFKREIALLRALLNRANMMLSVGAAVIPLAILPVNPLRDASGVVIVILSGVLHLVTNLGIVTLVVHWEHAVPLRKALSNLLPRPVTGFAISYVVLTGLGVITAWAYRDAGAWAVAAILIPLLFARVSILGARAQQELSERVQKQQEALLLATEKVFEERENERKRIAEDIHDSSLQLLAAATYGIGNAEEFLGTGREELAAEAIVGARDAVEGAIKDLRASLVDLRRSSIEEGGLLETITKFADQVSTVWAAQVIIKGEVAHEPPIPVALAAFQILQESLINAMKHAQGSTVTVEIEDGDGQFHIVVADDGPGFDPEDEVGEDHVGMRLMKERAARVGGRIVLNSAPGNGTRLEAILPGGVGQ